MTASAVTCSSGRQRPLLWPAPMMPTTQRVVRRGTDDRIGRGEQDGLGQICEHLDELGPGPGRVDLARTVGELVERDAALGAVPAQAIDHLRPFLVGKTDLVGRATLWLEAHAAQSPSVGHPPASMNCVTPRESGLRCRAETEAADPSARR